MASALRDWWIHQVEHRLVWGGPAFPKTRRARFVHWLGWQLHDWRRRLEGARWVKQGPTIGCVVERDLEIEFGGMCPVQGEGIVDGRVCYYRSRGSGWQFHVAAPGKTHEDAVFDDDAWEYCEEKYIWPAGGYVAADVSVACIRKAVAKFREENHA